MCIRDSPDGGGHGDQGVLGGLDRQVGETAADPLGERYELALADVRYQGDELLTAVTREHRSGPPSGEQALCHLVQYPIAGLVPVRVIDVLEMIQVDHEQSDPVAAPGRPPALGGEHGLEVPAVVYPGQRVGHGRSVLGPDQLGHAQHDEQEHADAGDAGQCDVQVVAEQVLGQLQAGDHEHGEGESGEPRRAGLRSGRDAALIEVAHGRVQCACGEHPQGEHPEPAEVCLGGVLAADDADHGVGAVRGEHQCQVSEEQVQHRVAISGAQHQPHRQDQQHQIQDGVRGLGELRR